MAQLRELQRKLDSVRGLKDVVNAMRNLAAVYVRRAEAALRASRPYGDIVNTALQLVLDRAPVEAPPEGPEQPALAVVFASDQGLAGPFNERVCSEAVSFVQSRSAGTEVAVIGMRGRALLQQRGLQAVLAARSPTSLEGIRSHLAELSAQISEAYHTLGPAELYFVFNAYESVGSFAPKTRRIVPPVNEELQAGPGRRFTYEPILTAPPEELLGRLIEEYVFIELYRSLLESHASENGARLTSMTAAGSSIDDRLEILQQEFQSVRQESITAELMDVVSGTEALREEGP
jgi:F-type H+-transporting ATPase subunit gamma